jgi:hypothetical protein
MSQKNEVADALLTVKLELAGGWMDKWIGVKPGVKDCLNSQKCLFNCTWVTVPEKGSAYSHQGAFNWESIATNTFYGKPCWFCMSPWTTE